MTIDQTPSFDRIPIWLDCDPGHDDAVGVLMGAFLPQFELLGISASYGNAPPKKTAYNTLSLLTAMGKTRDIPVYAGAQKPWVREARYAPDIHGESGLDGTTLLPIPDVPLCTDVSYLCAMEKAIEAHAGRISVVSTGSLTSVATLLDQRPHLKPKIKFISIMGGGIHQGNSNMNGTAEFNIWIDPQAANSLFRDPAVNHKCILVPLDLTHKAIATKSVEERVLGDGSSNLRKLFYELFLFFAKTYENAQGFETGPPVHDPLTLMPLLQFYGLKSPRDVGFVYKRLDLLVVEDESDQNLGQTKVLSEYSSESSRGAIVGFELNIDYFWGQFLSALDSASINSPL
ncbi:trifunctional uridine nucleosidase/nicotinamide riboside hydrolase/nicotinic acid riboside hydrolase [Lachancea thermotolerans CBS 6340]|uniref:KLTH0G02860p n=1 Tax=Lachancea thermotolerans (strain ATCC 56472 / CBS 6340 / NRRL Y-8284) TaxID=559295 RepID=C5DLR5_LACTC|nr:KLTH0G02860p [Lachancea thermotolerans CBS 6340]CAR24726.1 KLTH0G02860p [Lachancea thermotolerans CBS 6340]